MTIVRKVLSKGEVKRDVGNWSQSIKAYFFRELLPTIVIYNAPIFNYKGCTWFQICNMAYLLVYEEKKYHKPTTAYKIEKNLIQLFTIVVKKI